ncbi:hypothetical protein SPRG_05071 [Saprolegnia parasitica CBS 223.65]|uniref:Uncharacterized protein n=1 Tax=Saprolegnia parasitica (strain CBS 223.65) TaxID=695850 RepID=A0A067CMA6_SAPPC|nr:hypothetical protein SPRG_05071 [Saprolegnia parasitica CBS 223.65]KDO30360.1 hypothetical protein SPRG_05071 [Saprolegnia parasitica CBS 223.65]|eukprot:XP_012198970.1 hypothetical protein SPRG_05071 [Saprolegnia parasitica CBS 223.65]
MDRRAMSAQQPVPCHASNITMPLTAPGCVRATTSPEPVSSKPAQHVPPVRAPIATAVAPTLRRRKSRHTYAPFRPTVFTDKLLVPEQHDYVVPLDLAADSAKRWAARGPILGSTPKLDVKTGAMYAPTLDCIYDTGKHTLGYRVHHSLSGSTLWNTTKRFVDHPSTTDRVGPGAYESVTAAWEKARSVRKYPSLPPSPGHRTPFQPHLDETLDGQANELAPLDTWKRTTKAVSPPTMAFDKATRTTWIDVQRTRADKMRALPSSASCPTLELPNYISGVRTGVLKL